VPGFADLDHPGRHEEGDGLHRPVHRSTTQLRSGLERVRPASTRYGIPSSSSRRGDISPVRMCSGASLPR